MHKLRTYKRSPFDDCIFGLPMTAPKASEIIESSDGAFFFVEVDAEDGDKGSASASTSSAFGSALPSLEPFEAEGASASSSEKAASKPKSSFEGFGDGCVHGRQHST